MIQFNHQKTRSVSFKLILTHFQAPKNLGTMYKSGYNSNSVDVDVNKVQFRVNTPEVCHYTL